jgi:hypothetical protein
MKKIVLIIATIILGSSTMHAQGRGFGLGVMFGEPTGITAKGWLSARSAFDMGLAWSLRHDGYVNAHADYLWHFHDIVTTEQQVLPYLGIGGRVAGNNGSARAGVRIVGGLAWLPAQTPLDVFLEIAPIVDLAPSTSSSLNGGVGVRFFFR